MAYDDDRTPTLEEILAEIDRNYQTLGQPTSWKPFQPTIPPPAPPAQSAPEPSTLQKLLGGVGAAMAVPGAPLRALERAVYRHQFPTVKEERIPSSGQMLESLFYPEAPTTAGGGAAREAVKMVGEGLVDPVQMGLIAGVLAGAPAAVHVGLIGMMGYDMYHRVLRAVDTYKTKGWGPDLGRELGGLGVDAALIAVPTLVKQLRGPRLPVEAIGEPAPRPAGGPGEPPAAPGPPEVPPAPPGGPGAPPPFGPRLPYETPRAERQAPSFFDDAWLAAYRDYRGQGYDHDAAASLATDIVPGIGPSVPPPGVEKDMGPGAASPRTAVEARSDTVQNELRSGLEAALRTAREVGDTATEAEVLRQLAALGVEPPTFRPPMALPAEPPPPGAARPPAPMAGPGGEAYAAPPSPRQEPLPGPRTEAQVRPTIPAEPVTPGEATPVEAAGERAAAMRPDVQALVQAGRKEAEGGLAPPPQPGVVVSGPTRGIATGALPTAAIPPPTTSVEAAPLPGPPVPTAATISPAPPPPSAAVPIPPVAPEPQPQEAAGAPQAAAPSPQEMAADLATALRAVPEDRFVYHGTTKAAAESIRREGFPAGSWFAPTWNQAENFGAERSGKQNASERYADVEVFAVPKEAIEPAPADEGDVFGQEWIRAGLGVRSARPIPAPTTAPAPRQEPAPAPATAYKKGAEGRATEKPAAIISAASEAAVLTAPPAPEPTIAAAPSAEEQQPPEGMVRTDLGRGSGGKGWIVRAYDKGGATIRELTFPTEPAARPTLDTWKRQATKNRLAEPKPPKAPRPTPTKAPFAGLPPLVEELAGYKVGDQVTHGKKTGTVRQLYTTTEEKPRQRALVNFGKYDQPVDLAELIHAEAPAAAPPGTAPPPVAPTPVVSRPEPTGGAAPPILVEPFDPIKVLSPEIQTAIGAALERVPAELRAESRRILGEQVLRRENIRKAEEDVDFFKKGTNYQGVPGRKIPNAANKATAARDVLSSQQRLYEFYWESLQGTLKAVPDAPKIVKRLRQLVEGKGLRQAREAPTAEEPLTPNVMVAVGNWAQTAGVMNPEEAVEKVVQYAEELKTNELLAVPDEAVLGRLESLLSMIDSLRQTMLANYVDLPGLGRVKIKQALEEGPDNPNFGRILDHVRRNMNERRAFWELVSEHSEPKTADPELLMIAQALAEDLAAEPEKEGESHLTKTFMWGIPNPETRDPITTIEAISAIRDGRGRLYHRIQAAYEDASSAAGAQTGDVPFDIPEADDQPEPGTQETTHDKLGQVLIPGMLEAVMATPSKPIRKGERGEAPDFTERPLFTQEEDRKAREAEEKAKKAQRTLFSLGDAFGGRYGPPPRRPTGEQIEARKKWAERLLSVTKGGRGEGRVAGPSVAGAAGELAGEAPAAAERPQPAGAGAAQRPGEARGAVGGGRGRAVPAGVPGAPERARAATPRPGGKGIFQIVNPREQQTFVKPPKHELIPERLLGNGADGALLLSPDQRDGVAKAIEALQAGVGFLFQDGTGVGKTRELLAVATKFSDGGDKVLIVSKASAIEAVRRQGQLVPSGSYDVDSKAMGIPITFKSAGAPMTPGRIYLSTYHNLRDQPIDKNTVVLFDESHMMKNAGDSEIAAAGIDAIRRAKVAGFASATPGDKPYHMLYLTSIGLLEGKPVVEAMADLGCRVVERKRISKKLYKAARTAGKSEAAAIEAATEHFQVFKATSMRKVRQSTEALFDRLTAAGTVIKREVDMSPIDVRLVTVPVSNETLEKMSIIEKGPFDRKNMLMHMRRQLEPEKLPYVQQIIADELAEGRSVVVFAARVNESKVEANVKDEEGNIIDRVTLLESEGTLKQLREWLKAEGIEYSEIHGGMEGTSEENQAKFQSNKGRVVIATYEKGGTGINLDDRTGVAPRTMVMMTAPFDSVSAVQAIGRIHRYTTMSASRVHMLFSPHPVDQWNAAILGTKIKQLHAMVSGDIGLLDPEILSGGEEALQAGVTSYADARRGLLGHAPPDQKTDLGSASHYGAVVHWLKRLNVKMTLKGGSFEIQTNEGFAIEGSLDKVSEGYGYRHYLTWTDDPEAGDLVKHIAAQPSRLPKPTAFLPSAGAIRTKLSDFEMEGAVKRVVTKRQYDFFKATLDRFGAVWGAGGQPGNFAIMSSDALVFEGSLVPAKSWDNFGRAARGEEGVFTWRPMDTSSRTDLAERTEGVVKLRAGMNDMIRRLRRGERYKDFYERHEGIIQTLFGNDADLFKKLLAVTSTVQTVPGNVTLALRAYRQLRLAQPLIGYLPSVRAAIERIRDGEPDYARGPKIEAFDAAMLGRDLDALAIDRHVARFVVGPENVPAGQVSDAQHKEIRAVLREAMKVLGWTGREVHAAAWAARQIEGGLKPDEVRTYDEILRARATEIRRFRKYFGDVGLERGWVHAPGGSVEDREEPVGGPIDPGTVEGGLGIPIIAEVVTRPLLQWLPPQRRGTGLQLPAFDITAKPTIAEAGGVRIHFLGATVAEMLQNSGRVDWDGLEVRNIEDVVAIGQLARSTSIEHGHLLVIHEGRIVRARQVTSRVPNAVTYGDEADYEAAIEQERANLRGQGIDPKDVFFADVHNHPSGDPSPSSADMAHAKFLEDKLGPRYIGAVVTNHEIGTVIEKSGHVYAVRRQATVDPDPLLQAGPKFADYWGPAENLRGFGKGYAGKWRVTAENIVPFAHDLIEAGWAGAKANDPIIMLLDARGRLRTVYSMPRDAFLDPARFKASLERVGTGVGAYSSVVLWQGFDTTLFDASRTYAASGLIGNALGIAPGIDRPLQSALRASETSYPIPWFVMRGHPTRPGRYASELLEEGDVLAPVPPRLPYAGGGGADEPPPPRRPPGPPGPPEDGDDSWWQRRVLYARLRTRSRFAQANSFIDPAAIWDAIVLGSDAILRGFRSFGRWLAELLRDIPNIQSWGHRLWNYLKLLFAPRVIERPARPEDFDVAARGAGRPRGPIRPIPNVRREDIQGVIDRLEQGPPGEPGARRPLGVGRPGDLGINIDRIADENDLRQVWTDVARVLEERFNLARRRITAEEMHREALLSGLSEADILRLMREKGALNYAEILAARMLRQEAGIDFTNKWAARNDAKAELARFMAEDHPDAAALGLASEAALETERSMRASLQKMIGIEYGTAAAGSEAGRALYAHKIFIQSLSPEERFLQRLLRGTSPDERLVAELAAAIQRGDMATVNRLIRQLHRPGFWQTIVEYFINSVLSGPATLGANILGNLGHETMRTAERGIAGQLEAFGVRQAVERALTGQAAPRERFTREASEALRAQVAAKFGLPQALKLMWAATFSEEPRFMTGPKGEFHPPAIPGTLGKIVRTPGRWMQALDLGAKYAASQGERAAQVFRRVVGEFEESGRSTHEPEFRARMGEVNEELTRFIELEENRLAGNRLTTQEYSWMARNRHYSEMYRAMKKAADESTFQDETTRFTKYLQSMRNQYPYLTLIIPFIKTPERILVQALRRTPLGLARTLYSIRHGKLEGGAASDRLAQGLMGSAVMAGIYMLAKDGVITGGGPPDPEERRNWLATGKQPYAVKIGKTWVSLARIEPLATTLGIAADLAQAQDEKIAGDLLDKLHFSIVNNITNKTYLEGIVSLSEAVGDPDRYGARVWKRLIGAAVPNLLASAARAIDPTIRQTDSIQDTLMARVPVLSESIPARRGGTGEPVVRGETALSRFMSPFRYSEEAGPEKNLERLFIETGYNPNAPPRKIAIPGGMGRQIELTPEERRIYALYAQRATAFARTLTTNQDWSGLDIYAKEEILKRIYRFAHDNARRQIFRSVFYRLSTGKVQVA